jgi:hypothetical protein
MCIVVPPQSANALDCQQRRVTIKIDGINTFGVRRRFFNKMLLEGHAIGIAFAGEKSMLSLQRLTALTLGDGDAHGSEPT